MMETDTMNLNVALAVPLDRVLASADTIAVFEMFLVSEHADENLAFYLAVKDYEAAFPKCDFDHLLQMAREIVDRFVR